MHSSHSNYMITQLANSTLERIQLLLGVFLFCIFISYSLHYAFPEQATFINIAMAIQAITILLLMRKMMQNKTTVKPYFAWKANKYKVFKSNYKVKIIGGIILGGLTAIHFYIDYKYKGDIMPLVYDYGIGGLLAIGLKFIVLERNWNLGLSDKGIIFGSKFDTKLIEWKDIKTYEIDKSNASVLIICKKNHPINSIKLDVGQHLRNTELILEQAISK